MRVLAPALSARQLELELDAFDGPFDLMLTLVLKEELELSDVHVVEIVLAFVERLAEREQLDLEVAGEFLVLVAALLELKGRELAPAGAAADDDALEELLDADAAAAELAQRLARYRRIRAAADWLRGRLEEQESRFFRIGPAPLGKPAERPLARQDPERLAAAMRTLATEPPTPSLAHLALRLPPLPAFLERFRALIRERSRFVFEEEIDGLSRIEQVVAFLALLELRKHEEVMIGQPGHLGPIAVWRGPAGVPGGRA